MKYKNFPRKCSGRGEMLHSIQQFWIEASIIREMLYFGQHFKKSNSKQLKFGSWERCCLGEGCKDEAGSAHYIVQV